MTGRTKRLILGVVLVLLGLAGLGVGVAAYVGQAQYDAAMRDPELQLRLRLEADQQTRQEIAQLGGALKVAGPAGLIIGGILLLGGILVLVQLPPAYEDDEPAPRVAVARGAAHRQPVAERPAEEAPPAPTLRPTVEATPAVRAQLERLRIGLHRTPGDTAARLEYARGLRQVGQAAEAELVLEKGLALDPDAKDTRAELASLLIELERLDDGAMHLLILLAHAPEDVELHERLAGAYLRGGRLSEAHAELETLCRLDPSNPARQLVLADHLESVGDTEGWTRALGAAAELEPSLEGWMRLGERLEQLGRHEEAWRAYERACALAPRDPKPHARLGLAICARRGADGAEDALEHLEIALEQGFLMSDRERVQALRWVAAVELWRPGAGVARARAFVDGADPDTLDADAAADYARCLTALGRVDEDAGDLSTARERYESAFRINQEATAAARLAVLWEAKGDAAHKSGDLTTAADAYDLALGYAPGGAASPKAEEVANTIAAAARRKRHLWLLALAVPVLLLVGVALARGRVAVELDKEATIIVRENGSIVALGDGKALTTDALWTGSEVEIEVARPGYETATTTASAGFLFRTTTVSLELVPATGTLKLTTDPVGATVRVENAEQKESCTTPCELDGLLSVDTEVSIRHRVFAPIRLRTRVPAGGVVDLGTVEPLRGELTVHSEPPGAGVLVTNQYQRERCAAPCTLPRILAGTTRIVVSRPGLPPNELSRVVAADTRTEVTASFLGAVRVDSWPSGARVTVAGQDGVADTTPTTIGGLLEGTATVTLELPGYASRTLRAQVTRGQTTDLGTMALITTAEQENRNEGMITVAGRTWELTPSPQRFDPMEARRYCARLRLGGHRSWRLPKQGELKTLVTSTPHPRVGAKGAACYMLPELNGPCGRYKAWWDINGTWGRMDNYRWYMNFSIPEYDSTYGSAHRDEWVRCILD